METLFGGYVIGQEAGKRSKGEKETPKDSAGYVWGLLIYGKQEQDGKRRSWEIKVRKAEEQVREVGGFEPLFPSPPPLSSQELMKHTCTLSIFTIYDTGYI